MFNEAFTFDARQAPFGVESKYVVATGTTISGKTSVLDALKVSYEPEVARIVIERELRCGRTKAEIRVDEGAFQRSLVDEKLRIEASRPKDVPWFFDRAMPDSITYYRAGGLDPGSLIEHCKRVKIAVILLFDPLPDSVVETVLRSDPVRTEDKEMRQKIDHFLRLDYEKLGYEPVIVPVGSLQERVQFVLNRLAERGITNLGTSGESAH